MSFWKKYFQKKAKEKEKKDEDREKLREEKTAKPAEIYQTERGNILGPIISEKTHRLARQGQYTFYVRPEANKIEIKQEIEKMFGVKVAEVRTINLKKRVRGVTRIPSVRPKIKKAIVKLEKGTIPIFE